MVEVSTTAADVSVALDACCVVAASDEEAGRRLDAGEYDAIYDDPFGLEDDVPRQLRGFTNLLLIIHDLLELGDEPWVNRRSREHFCRRQPEPQGVKDVK